MADQVQSANDNAGGVWGAVANIGGDVLESVLNYASAKASRDRMEYLSNTAHQREVVDLKAAGLNPILSATGGRGASTPELPFSQVDTSGIKNSAKAYYDIKQSGAESTLKNKQTELVDAQIKTEQTNRFTSSAQQAKLASEKTNIDYDSLVKLKSLGLTQAQIVELLSRSNLQDKQSALTTAQVGEVGKRIQLTDAQIIDLQAKTQLTKEEIYKSVLQSPQLLNDYKMYSSKVGNVMSFVDWLAKKLPSMIMPLKH